MRWDKVKALLELYATVELCGSRVTCDPPPVDTDEDYLVVVRPYASVDHILEREDFKCESGEAYPTGTFFRSWRNSNINLIVTDDAEFGKKHRVATALCKRLNLLDKNDRVAVFQAVLYAVTWRDSNA